MFLIGCGFFYAGDMTSLDMKFKHEYGVLFDNRYIDHGGGLVGIYKLLMRIRHGIITENGFPDEPFNVYFRPNGPDGCMLMSIRWGLDESKDA